MATDLVVAHEPARARIVPWLIDTLQAERERWVLWMPVGLAAGIGLYFALPSEPPSWQGAVALAGSALLAWLCRRNMPAVAGAIAAAVIALGFVAAQLRTQMVAAPVLARDIGPVAVRGRVVEIEPMPHGRRLLLDQV